MAAFRGEIVTVVGLEVSNGGLGYGYVLLAPLNGVQRDLL